VSKQVRALKIELHILADDCVDTKQFLENLKEDLEFYTENLLSVNAILLEEHRHLLFSEHEAEA